MGNIRKREVNGIYKETFLMTFSSDLLKTGRKKAGTNISVSPGSLP
jgi:hypothetical protein